MGQIKGNIKLINIDWLQFAVINKKKTLKKANWIKKDYQTRLFTDVYEYISHDTVFFEMVCNPKSKIINENLCIIKVSNEILYHPDCHKYIEYLLIEEEFIYNNMTRLDLCCDFAKFDNEMYPDEFIYNFFIAKYLKNNKTHCKLEFEQTFMTIPEYIKFGSGYSAVSAYLYNKSKEFRDVKHKAYITEMWEKNGLKSNCDMWRLEFSIKEFNTVLTDKDTGQQFKIDLNFITDFNNILSLFTALYVKYFDIRINDGKCNKSRMKRIQLFEFEDVNTCWLSERENLDTDRSDKIMIKKLHNMQNEIRAIKGDYELEIEAVKEYLIRKKNLTEWAKDRHFIKPDEKELNSEWYKENEESTINSLYNF